MQALYFRFCKNLLEMLDVHPALLDDFPYLGVLLHNVHYPLLPDLMRPEASDHQAHSHAFSNLNLQFSDYQKYQACLLFLVDNYHYYREILCLEARAQAQKLKAYYEDLQHVEQQLNHIIDAIEECRLSPTRCRFLGQYFIPSTMPPISRPMLLEPAFCDVPRQNTTSGSLISLTPSWVELN